MKKIALALLVLVIAAAGALLWLRDNVDGLLKTAIETHGSAMTQAKVSVGAVHIDAASGRGMIRDLTIANPAGFNTAHALKLASLELEIDPATLLKDVVTVRRIAVVAPDVIYEKGDHETNFDALQKNIATYLAPATKTPAGKKLIVEEFTLTDAKAHASAAFLKGETVGVALPDIRLQQIGRAKGGVTPGELGQEITAALKARLAKAVSFDNLMKSTGEALGKAGSAIKGLFK